MKFFTFAVLLTVAVLALNNQIQANTLPGDALSVKKPCPHCPQKAKETDMLAQDDVSDGEEVSKHPVLVTDESDEDETGFLDDLKYNKDVNVTDNDKFPNQTVPKVIVIHPLNRTVLDKVSIDGRCLLDEGYELQCPEGACCSAFGWCTFDKSSCPSTYGPNVRMAADGVCVPGEIMCPMNSCCSKWGYCGFSEMHCSAEYDCQENCQEHPVPGLVRIGNHTELPLDKQIMRTQPIIDRDSIFAQPDSELETESEYPIPAPAKKTTENSELEPLSDDEDIDMVEGPAVSKIQKKENE